MVEKLKITEKGTLSLENTSETKPKYQVFTFDHRLSAFIRMLCVAKEVKQDTENKGNGFRLE